MDNSHLTDRGSLAVDDGELEEERRLLAGNMFDREPESSQSGRSFASGSQMHTSSRMSLRPSSQFSFRSLMATDADQVRTPRFGGFPASTAPQSQLSGGYTGYGAPANFGAGGVRRSFPVSSSQYSHLRDHSSGSRITAKQEPDSSLEVKIQDLEARFKAHEYGSGVSARRHSDQIADLVSQKGVCANMSNMAREMSNRIEDIDTEIRRHIEMHRFLGLEQMLEANTPVNQALNDMSNAMTDLQTRTAALENEKAVAAAAAADTLRSNSLPAKRLLVCGSNSPEQARPSRVVVFNNRKSEAIVDDRGPEPSQVGCPALQVRREANQVTTHSLQSFLASIKTLDFSSAPQLIALNRQIESLASASFEYPIFHYDYPREAAEIFYLKVGGAMSNHVLPSQRRDFDFDADKRSQSPEDLSAVQNSGILECVLSGRDLQADTSTIPEFLLPLGEIYRKRVLHNSLKSRDTTEATNFFVFLSVPNKSVWAMYHYEKLTKGVTKPRRINFKPEDRLFKRGRQSDVFCLLKDVGDWESHKKDMLQTNLQVKEAFGVGNEREKDVCEPLFTVPLWEDLKSKVELDA
ncbi:hypothetical protein B0T14DRAFT_581221 [Immersiella caudata]|uniref:Uncharacterized protein n=1 Tax=Immersiella caudata TaxID=314043 RepID=A0AA40C2V0_9PEZI|nr:hypothetical protein B0T14DRAFT_581221 [Immersiella caudata]